MVRPSVSVRRVYASHMPPGTPTAPPAPLVRVPPLSSACRVSCGVVRVRVAARGYPVPRRRRCSFAGPPSASSAPLLRSTTRQCQCRATLMRRAGVFLSPPPPARSSSLLPGWAGAQPISSVPQLLRLGEHARAPPAHASAGTEPRRQQAHTVAEPRRR